VDSSENKCPQCKAVIGKITYKEDGIEIQKAVEERHQGMIEYNCAECR
jgi:phage FluMu protein Com